MPEKYIQKVDQYLADKYNKGVLTPDKSAAVHSTPESYNHALNVLYNDKYTNSFKTLDEFKTAYQSEHGDPFKKKVQTVVNAPVENVPKVATFQPQEERSQILQTDAEQSLATSSSPVNQDTLYSSGLLEKAKPGEIKQTDDFINPANLDYSNQLQSKNTIASESTSVNTPKLTLEEIKNISNVPPQDLGQYLVPLNRAVSDAVPQMVKAAFDVASYGAEKLTGQAQPYTFEEFDKQYKASPTGGTEQALQIISGLRLATLWHQFNEENLTASPDVENSIAGQVSGGLGQAITMLAPSGIAKGLTMSTEMLTAANYANTLSKSATIGGAALQVAKSQFTQPATYIAASQVFNSEFDQAYNQTGDADTAMKAAVINTVASSGLESMPIMHFMNRLDKTTGGGVKKVLIGGLQGGFEEATTEIMQQAVSNMVASNLYDETRKIADGMVQSGEVGGLTGFALNVIFASLGAKLKTVSDPYEAQEIQKAQAYVSEQKTAFDKSQTEVAANMENQITQVKTADMQDAVGNGPIGAAEMAKVTEIQASMPNAEAVTPKTVGLTNSINNLIVEKQQLYDKVTTVKQQEEADVRAAEIDNEIKSKVNTIGEFYSNPSKKIIDALKHTENATTIGEGKLPIERAGTNELVQPEGNAGSVQTENQGTGQKTNIGDSLQQGTGEQINPEEDLTDPEHVAKLYHEERQNPVHITPQEQAIAEIIQSGISKNGVKQQGDQNKFTNSMAKSYFKEGGNTIDQVAQQASTVANKEISPEDVWDFMNKFPQGPDMISRPGGNPRLAELAGKYTELTGKQLNKVVAAKIATASKIPVGRTEENVNTVIDKYVKDGEIDLDAIEADIPALPFLFDLTEEQTKTVEDYVKELRKTKPVHSGSADMGETPSGETKVTTKTEEIKKGKLIPIKQEHHFKEVENTISDFFKQHPELGILYKGIESTGSIGRSHYYTIENGPLIVDKIRISNHSTGNARMQNEFNFSATKNGLPAIEDTQKLLNHYFGKQIKPINITDKSHTIEEIKSKSLSHVKVIAMGSGIASGTYLSTEQGNRYKGRGKLHKAEVTIENPYIPSEDLINEERNKLLKDNISEFNLMNFEGAQSIPDNPTIDDLSDSGTEKLAKLFTKDLQDKGYDSMYLPESKTQEGELVVFDRSKVKLEEDTKLADSLKLSETAWLEKYPDENYQDARAEYTKDTQNVIEANKKGELQAGVIQMAGIVKAIPFDTRFTKGFDKVNQAWIKNTRVGGSIPFDLVFDYSYKRKNVIALRFAEVETQAKAVEKAIKKHLKLDKNITEQINEVLAGRTPSMVLPSEVLGEIAIFRDTINALSAEMKAEGLVQDSYEGTLDQKGDYYLNRSYKKWTDPVWKENIPEDVMNRAVTYLKSEYRDFYKDKYEKTQSAFKNREKRIRDFRTKIDNYQTKVTENNNRLLEYKAKNEEKLTKITDQLTKLKKKVNKEQAGPDLSGKTKQTKLEKRIEYLEALHDETSHSFNKIYDAKKEQFDKQNNKIEAGIAEAETAAYNLQQKNYPKNMQEYLDKLTNPDEGEIGALINQILYAPTQEMIQTGKAGGIKGTILKQRNEKLNESPEIRALMGEYQDPFINFLNTTHKMITAVENYKFQKQLRENGMGIIFQNKPTGEFHRKIEGDAFRGLTEDGDIYTTEVFEEALKNLNGMIQQGKSPGMEVFKQVVSFVKVGKTVISTPGAFANYTSNLWSIAANGWNPSRALTKLVPMSKAERSAEVKDLQKLGVIGQSVVGRELKARMSETAGYVPVEKYARALPGGDQIVDFIQGYTKVNSKLFEWGDTYARVVGFYSEVEAYRNVHPEWSENQLREHAAKIIAKISPTYDFAYPWVQQFRNSPFFSTFATFPAEQWRTLTNQAKQARQDIKDGHIAIGARRIGAFMLTAALGSYELIHLAGKLIGADEEDLEKLSLFVPPYSKNNPLIYLDKKGAEYTYVDASRFTYYSYFMQPYLAYVNGEMSEEELNAKMFDATREIMKPFTSVNIVTETGADVIFGYKSGTDEKITSSNDSNYDALMKLTAHMVNKLEPTNFKIAQNWYDLAKFGKTKYGTEITPQTAALSTFGIKTRTFDVNKAFSYPFYNLKEQGEMDKNAFERSYKNARNEEEQTKAVEMYRTQLTNQIKKMGYLAHSAVSSGADVRDIKKTLSRLPNFTEIGIKAGDALDDETLKKFVNAQISQYIGKPIQ